MYNCKYNDCGWCCNSDSVHVKCIGLFKCKGEETTMSQNKELSLSEQVKQLEQQLQEKTETLANLKKQLKQENKRLFGFVPQVGSNETFYTLDIDGSNLCTAYEDQAFSPKPHTYTGLMWETESEAQEFANAMNTFMELRVQPECVEPQWNSFTINYYCDEVDITNVTRGYNSLVPWFSSHKEAKAIRERFGDERLIQMFQVLQGIKD